MRGWGFAVREFVGASVRGWGGVDTPISSTRDRGHHAFLVERSGQSARTGDMAGPSTARLAKGARRFAQDDNFGVGGEEWSSGVAVGIALRAVVRYAVCTHV